MTTAGKAVISRYVVEANVDAAYALELPAVNDFLR